MSRRTELDQLPSAKQDRVSQLTQNCPVCCGPNYHLNLETRGSNPRQDN